MNFNKSLIDWKIRNNIVQSCTTLYLKSHITFASVTVKTSREQKLYWRLIIVQTDREHSSTLQEPTYIYDLVWWAERWWSSMLWLLYHWSCAITGLLFVWPWWGPGHSDSGRKWRDVYRTRTISWLNWESGPTTTLSSNTMDQPA